MGLIGQQVCARILRLSWILGTVMTIGMGVSTLQAQCTASR
jgi:hypothetical protein